MWIRKRASEEEYVDKEESVGRGICGGGERGEKSRNKKGDTFNITTNITY